MSGDDLGVLIVIIFSAVLWTAFNGLFYVGEIEAKDFEQFNQTQKASISDVFSTNFLSYMFFDSEYAIINYLVFIPMAAVVTIIGIRFLRGV